jgi:hypothetical protein
LKAGLRLYGDDAAADPPAEERVDRIGCPANEGDDDDDDEDMFIAGAQLE